MIEYENLKKSNAKFKELYLNKIEKIIESGWYILGEEVKKFEEEFSEFNGSKFSIGVANGLDALKISLVALNFEKKSEILVASNTYIATILAIVDAGYIPILVEPDIKTYNIDTEQIKKKITNKTKAICITHMYGKSCKMDEILNICTEYNLKLIEDCAQSHGAMYKNKKTGTFGDFGCFSFYPTKNLGGLGDGGLITTNDEEKADRLRYLRNYGSKIKYENKYLGYNSRLDEIQAGILRIKLEYLNEINDKKRKLAEIYNRELSELIIKPVINESEYDVYHIYAIRIEERSKLKEFLYDNGIKTEIHYPIPPNKQEAMNGIINEEYPISEKIHETILSLPISYYHTESEIIKVVEKINEYIKNNKKYLINKIIK